MENAQKSNSGSDELPALFAGLKIGQSDKIEKERSKVGNNNGKPPGPKFPEEPKGTILIFDYVALLKLSS